MDVRLTFHGAAGTVTGSCFLLEAGPARLLVDCGMFQGPKTLKELNYGPFPFDSAAVDAVLLTHAHTDHAGLLPKLTLAGFRGPVHATAATVDLLDPMLRDSGGIQEAEVEALNRRNARRGRGAVTPIYTARDAERTLRQLSPVAYGAWLRVAPGVRARWWNAGHLLGSASIEVEAGDGDRPLRLLFSGDIGPDSAMLHPGPEAPAGFDHVLCESTYGGTDRRDAGAARRRALLAAEIEAGRARGGAFLVPSFAVERAQALLTDLAALVEDGVAPFRVFVDSPLAAAVTAVFDRHAMALDEGEALRRALRSPHLTFTESVEDSKAVGRLKGFHVVIAGSGMCDAGRIRHHLADRLPDPAATVMMVGFQAQGSLGRILLDGAPRVRIRGEEVAVRAAIRSLDVYSGHADGAELVDWVRERLPIRGALFLVHGEPPAIEALAARVAPALLPPDRVIAPAMDEAFALTHEGARRLGGGAPRRIAPEAAARLDWHNDLSRLMLDIGQAVETQADERGRQALLRRLRRALDQP
jgi:metallo-beta-lactamase family protein